MSSFLSEDQPMQHELQQLIEHNVHNVELCISDDVGGVEERIVNRNLQLSHFVSRSRKRSRRAMS